MDSRSWVGDPPQSRRETAAHDRHALRYHRAQASGGSASGTVERVAGLLRFGRVKRAAGAHFGRNVSGAREPPARQLAVSGNCLRPSPDGGTCVLHEQFQGVRLDAIRACQSERSPSGAHRGGLPGGAAGGGCRAVSPGRATAPYGSGQADRIHHRAQAGGSRTARQR